MNTKSADVGAKPLLLILGNQLFPPVNLPTSRSTPVFMAEDFELCTYERHHQIKIALFLSAMRNYRDELEKSGRKVHYLALDDKKYSQLDFTAKLQKFIDSGKHDCLVSYEIEDKFFEKKIRTFCSKNDLKWIQVENPMFLTSRAEFANYLGTKKRPFMKTFYEQQRRRLKIMVTPKGEPLGGRWSFDTENRKPLPKNLRPPEPLIPQRLAVETSVIKLVHAHFKEHPGNAEDLWVPTTRAGAHRWLEDFLEHRLAAFGPYEDAFSYQSTFIYHSALSPLMNIGLLLPTEVLTAALQFAEKKSLPLASLEGFVRQIIGWREFVRGIYQNFSDTQEKANHWGSQRKLSHHWYKGSLGIPLADHCVQKAERFAYTHHIERLMVLSNLMLMCEVAPKEAHRWFMEMFVDSSDWVMGPNVYGMGLMSDGGIFATKPYICGSNYWRKMGDRAPRGEWEDIVDGLYWRFLDKNKAKLASNPRIALLLGSLKRMEPARRKKILAAAEAFQEKVTSG